MAGFQNYSSTSQQLIDPDSPNVVTQLQRNSSFRKGDGDRNGMVEGLRSSSFYRKKESFRSGGGFHPGPTESLKQNDLPSSEMMEDGSITVDIDRALETLSVEQAREILAKLDHGVKEKQIELQSMVTERYPELIESADMIVSMKDKAEKVVKQLETFPRKLDELLKEGEKLGGVIPADAAFAEKHSASITTRKAVAREDSKKEGRENLDDTAIKSSAAEEVVLLMLHAPSAIWSALDEGKLLIAARLYLKCLQAMSNSHPENLKSVDSTFLRGQWAYASQFPEKFFSEAKVVLFALNKLEYEERTVQICDALAATMVVASITLSPYSWSSLPGIPLPESSIGGNIAEMKSECYTGGEAAPTPSMECRSLKGTGRGALVLFLQQRTAVLAAAMRECTTIDLVEGFQHVLWLLNSTILDIYAAFSSSFGGIRKLIARCCEGISIASPLLNESEALFPTSAEQRDIVTEWLGIVFKKMRCRLRKVLRDISNAECLVSVRQTLWNIMQQHAADERWKIACSTLVDVSTLPPSLGLFSSPVTKWGSVELDMWSTLFSRTFSGLTEDLLRRSHDVAIRSVLETLEWALSAGGRFPSRAGGSKEDFHNMAVSALPLPVLPAHEAVYFAAMLVARLNDSLKAMRDDAESFVQQGDVEAGSRLLNSLRVQSASLVVRLLNRLRVIVEGILGTQRRLSQSDVEMASIIGRVVWLLSGKGGEEMKDALSLSRTKDARKTGASAFEVQLSQIEAAFDIACTDRDGVLNGLELMEALQTIGAVTPECDTPPLPCSTYAEFCFLSVPTCEVISLEEHLHEALKLIAVKSTKIWEQYYLEPACTAVIGACESISLACQTKSMVDSRWQQQYGTWEKASIGGVEGVELGEEDNIWVPASVTPSVKSFVESISMALSALVATADLGTNSEVIEGSSHFSACPVSQACVVALDRTVSVLSTSYVKMCCGTDAPTVSAPESARIQILTDIEWLRLWVPDSERWFGKAEQDLEALFDPIDLQTYKPFIQATALKCVANSRLFLERLTRIPVIPWASLAPSTSQLDYVLNVNMLPLVKQPARFELLPLAVTPGKIISNDKTKRLEQQHHQSDDAASRYSSSWFGEKEEQSVAAFAGLVRGTVSSLWQSSRNA